MWGYIILVIILVLMIAFADGGNLFLLRWANKVQVQCHRRHPLSGQRRIQNNQTKRQITGNIKRHHSRCDNTTESIDKSLCQNKAKQKMTNLFNLPSFIDFQRITLIISL